MFFVINKEKLYAYFVSILTVIVLFFMANTIIKQETVQTSSQSSKQLPIYQVQTEEKNVAFTMNCAW